MNKQKELNKLYAEARHVKHKIDWLIFHKKPISERGTAKVGFSLYKCHVRLINIDIKLRGLIFGFNTFQSFIDKGKVEAKLSPVTTDNSKAVSMCQHMPDANAGKAECIHIAPLVYKLYIQKDNSGKVIAKDKDGNTYNVKI